MNEKWWEGKRSEWANYRPAFQSHDNNIKKKKAMVGKPRKNNKKFQTLHTYLRYLDTIKMDKTYIIWLLWMW